MKIGILGTGIVGRSLAEALASKGHHIMLGSRDAAAALKHTDRDQSTLEDWIGRHKSIQLGLFSEAAAFGELIINATAGAHSIEAVKQAGVENFDDKLLIDAANPLDHTASPPMLAIANNSSLGEQLQTLLPTTKVIKALNTVNTIIMVDPTTLADGEHDLFICGNDDKAKVLVANYLHEWFGWRPEHIIDLGDITNARGTEMYLALWIRLFTLRKNPQFNIRVVS